MFTQEHLFIMLILETYNLLVYCIELYPLLLYYVLNIVLHILRTTTDCYKHIICLMTCFISKCHLWVLLWIDKMYLYLEKCTCMKFYFYIPEHCIGNI